MPRPKGKPRITAEGKGITSTGKRINFEIKKIRKGVIQLAPSRTEKGKWGSKESKSRRARKALKRRKKQ